jgi:hypothetical protein
VDAGRNVAHAADVPAHDGDMLIAACVRRERDDAEIAEARGQLGDGDDV